MAFAAHFQELDMATWRILAVSGTALAGILGLMTSPALAISPSPAIAGPTAIAGYLWSGDTNGYYAFDSTGRTATIEPDGTGSYFAVFPGLQHLANEHIDLSTYGSGAACQVYDAQNEPSNLTLAIDCNNSSGAPADSAFDVVVTQPTRPPSGVFDYDLAPATGSRRLTGDGQYNSSGRANSVRHLSTGRYQITMPGPRASNAAGTAQVTDQDKTSTTGHCELAGWHGTRAGVIVDVGCFKADGARQNRTFGVSYVRSGNIMGYGGPTSADRVVSAYAYASRPTANVYQPASQYSSARGAYVAVLRLRRGMYLVVPSGSAGSYATYGGDVQLSAVGTSDHRCYVDEWDEQLTPMIYVDCVTRTGARADSAFTIQWVVP
jgi:hypothetical protein